MRQLLYKDNIMNKNSFLYFVDESEITEKLKKKYGNYTLGTSIYISNNDNLVISNKSVDVVATDEEYKEALNQYKNYINQGNTAYERMTFAKNVSPKAFLRLQDVHKSELKLVSKKFILTKDGKLYYIRGKGIYRLAFNTKEQIETLESILRDFVLEQMNLLDNANFSLMNSYFANIFPIFKSANDINDLRTFIVFLSASPRREAFCMSLGDYPKIFRQKFSSYKGNYNALLLYHRYKAMGFNDNNVIAKLAFGGCTYISSAKGLRQYLKDAKKEYANDKNLNVENIVAARVTSNSNDTWILRVSLNMYYSHKREMRMLKAKPFKPDFFRRTLKDNYDYLSALMREDRALRDKREYPYDESYNVFSKQIEDYEFTLPKNSEELVRLANVMHNCVAGYSSGIFFKKCIIVYATNNKMIKDYIKNGENDDMNILNTIKSDIKNGKISDPLCIELSPLSSEKEKQVVRQCYTVHNHYASKEVQSIANRYFDLIEYKNQNSNIINDRLIGNFDYDELELPF